MSLGGEGGLWSVGFSWLCVVCGGCRCGWGWGVVRGDWAGGGGRVRWVVWGFFRQAVWGGFGWRAFWCGVWGGELRSTVVGSGILAVSWWGGWRDRRVGSLCAVGDSSRVVVGSILQLYYYLHIYCVLGHGSHSFNYIYRAHLSYILSRGGWFSYYGVGCGCSC